MDQRRPVDADGNPVPWMNYSIIGVLNERLNSKMSLFEYGSGYSTCYFANRVKSVTSVEYDKKWLSLVEEMVPSNVKLVFMSKDIDGDYCRVISSMDEKFDVVIVDGRDRVNCIKQSANADRHG